MLSCIFNPTNPINMKLKTYIKFYSLLVFQSDNICRFIFKNKFLGLL